MTNINLIEAVRSYINRMIEDCGPTIKGLVMDKETVCDKTIRFISTVLNLHFIFM